MSSSLQSNTTGEDEALNNNGTSSDWDYLKKPGFQPRPLRLAICGAGAAGLCLAYKILEAQKNGVLGPVEFVLLEKESDYTGTWHANRYPGCRCDIPSAAYQFSFAPYADWPDFYSYAGEIKKYFKTFAQKHGIVLFIRLRHKVTAAVYDEASGSWAVTVEDLDTSQTRTETYDVFAPATGVLNNANRPAIAGMESFTLLNGLRILTGRPRLRMRECVGSSGLQIIGTIASYCKSLDIYARSKVWIVPTIVSLDSLKDRDWKSDNFSYSEEERTDFAKDPEKLYSHIKEVFDKMNTRFEAKRSNSEMQKMSQNTALEHMRKSLDREDLLLKLIPDYAVGANTRSCFYGSDPIKSITPTSILTESGIERPVDRIILATGFDTGFRPQYTLRGRGGIDLRDVWAQKPKAYMSIALAGFPNMFLMGSGPGIPYANGSILPGMEAQADYVVACLSKMQKQDIKTMEVDRDAQDEYNIQQASTVKDLIWSERCSSWYKGGTVDGEPYALYAGSTLQYRELLSSPRWEDWKFIPLYKNRFAYLGNGESSVEATGGDRAYYFTLENCANALTAGNFRSA
ncbi:hypothetical protein EV421DRAFT_1980155 [Armillaria borealis]|uniref:FAD/NAD(P)-binding domain-containing protein n=1 Tax=Armillaria borealis TaxID=47425 RepID=A0AA39J5N9_9AGAR|nr:hypothetical protein EV421DRAFT_1980155 [Armillaria borealis]